MRPFETKFVRLLLPALLALMLLLASCRDITQDFIPYNSLEDPLYGLPVWEGHNTAFSLKYPSGWEATWLSETGIVAFLMASDKVEQVLENEDHGNAIVMIVVGNEFRRALDANPDLTMESLLLNWVGGSEMIQDPKSLQINGHEAAQAIQNYNDEIQIVTVMLEGNADLLIFASSPVESDETYRPILEAIIGTIDLQSR